MRSRKVTIIKAPPPEEGGVNEQLQWLGGSLGLFNLRDKDKSCFRIFVSLLRSNALTSDALAERTGLTRGTVVHHLKKLINAGLVEKRAEGYALRVEKLSTLVAQLKQEVDETFALLSAVATSIDEQLGR